MQDYLILIYGLIVGLGWLWQMHLFRERDPLTRGHACLWLPGFIRGAIPQRLPARAAPPYLFGLLVVVGVLVYSGFEYQRGLLSGDAVWNNLWRALGFAAVITLKAIWAPLLLALGVAWGIHCYLEGLPVEWLPVLQGLLEWIFVGLPGSVFFGYNLLALGYLFVVAMRDSFEG